MRGRLTRGDECPVPSQQCCPVHRRNLTGATGVAAVIDVVICIISPDRRTQ